MMADGDRQMRSAAESRQIRYVAESINASLNSHQSSITHSVRTPDTINEVLMAGSRYNNRMSNVRRFFCHLVTFDFFFTIFMWVICIMISGINVQTAFVQQIVHYQIKTSLFDVVMAAALRFTVLLLFYALLYIDHWFIVALSTTTTCAFLLAKVFLYNWALATQPVCQVLLILVSFVLVWGEVWFLDIKVIPQETEARNWHSGNINPERTPLLSPSSVPPSFVRDNIGHFYTPMESPDHSDRDEDDRCKEEPITPFIPATISLELTPNQIEECKKSASTLLGRCYDLITSNDWKVQYVTPEGDTVWSMSKPGGKIFKITGVVNTSASKLIDCLFDGIESNTTWNKEVSESRKIYVVDENTDLVYQATRSFGNGAIGARDFVILRHRGQYDSYFISSGISVNFSVLPHRKNYVRGENGVGCYAAQSLPSADGEKCHFVWLLNTNLMFKWIPQRMTDMMMARGLGEFMRSLREHARTIQD